jgi:hypothetical protein
MIEHEFHRLVRRMIRFGGILGRENRVRLFGEAVFIPFAGINLDPNKGIAELVAQTLEPLGRYQPVSGETKPDHAQVLVDNSAFDLRQIVGRNV